jgi:succinoglycan biosynthesis transport protein ExoP
MQPIGGSAIPRRTLDVEDYIDIMRRHRGWIFGPFLVTLVASVVGVYMWPDSYESQATVRVVAQQVPENMVQSAVGQGMNQRISSMAQQIMSRTVLSNIINTFGLYPRERAKMPIEDVIEEMRLKKIKITPVANIGGGEGRTVPAFSVSFSYENRYLAQRVVQDLVTRFIDENIRNRSNATFQTTQFMKDNLDAAKKELDEIEGKLATFRTENNGRLPDQMNANMSQLNALQAQVTFLNGQLSRANQEKLQLENSIRITRDQIATLSKDTIEPAAIQAQQKNEKLAEVEREIANWENQLSAYKQRYTDTHPDVIFVTGRLNAAKVRRDELKKEETKEIAAAKKTDGTTQRLMRPETIREIRELENTVKRLQSAVEGKDLEISDLTKSLVRTNDSVRSYQGRIETVPLGERQFGDIIREREIAKEKYMDLDQKLAKAKIAEDMESRKQGETLELLDQASLPTYPTDPKRPLVISIGAAVGLLLGIAMAGAREMKDGSLKNLKDVRAYTQMQILGSVPLLENDFVVRRRKRLAWLGWTTASLAAVVVMSGSIVYYYVTKS